MSDLVSIVVPIYNMEDSIEKCVESLLHQDYPSIEIILVDDGSTDNSLDKCKKIALKDSRVKVYHTLNSGSGPARNYGITKASGSYIYFPDADDTLDANSISVLVTAMHDNKCDLVVFGYREIKPDKSIVKEKKYPELIQSGKDIRHSYSEYMGSSVRLGIQGAPWNKLFDLNLIKINGVSFPPLRRHQDEGFIARYMCFAKRVHFIPNVLYTHYTNDLKLQWKKYPTDYINAVIGLNETRKETILTWNPLDKHTHELIEIEYICNLIKALELSFSPKMGFNKYKRKKWLIKQIKKARMSKMTIPNHLGKYQKFVMDIIKKHKYNCLYMILHFKILVEQSKLYRRLRK